MNTTSKLFLHGDVFRLICSSVGFLLIAPCARAENPFLWMKSGTPEVAEWSGTEWYFQIHKSAKEERPCAANVSCRRIAKMSWGQIVRYRFTLPGELELDPLYFLVRDDVILDLTDDDVVYLIGTVATMKSAPQYEPKDVRALVEVGTHQASDEPWSSTVTTTSDTSTYLATHPSGHFSKLVWKRGVGLVEYSTGNGARKDGLRLQAGGIWFSGGEGDL